MNNTPAFNPADFKLKTPCHYQYEFHYHCLDDLIPHDHKVRLIWDFINNIDLSVCFINTLSAQCKVGNLRHV